MDRGDERALRMARGGQRVAPLAIALLIAFALLPMLLYGASRLREHRADVALAERERIAIERGGGASLAGPTEGMTIDAGGFGTVRDAPEQIAAAGARPDPARSDQMIAADVRIFIRALPRPPAIGRKSGEPLICTLEGPPAWQGKLVLVNGCLRMQAAGANSPGPLVIGRFALYRDSQGYLAAHLGGDARHEVRIGASNVRFAGVGCSMDAPVPAPADLAQACGISEMRRIGSMERRRRCDAADLARHERLREEFSQTSRRLATQRAACLASGGTERTCPPGVAPAPVELAYPDCLPE